MNKIYELDSNKALEVQGSFIYIGQENGKIYVKGSGLKKPFVASSLPAGLLKANEEALNLAKEAKIKELNALCAALLSRFESAALGETYIYDNALEDQLNLLGAVNAGSDNFVRCFKEGEAKVNLLHTFDELKQVYADSIAYKNALLFQCGILKSYVLGLQDVQLVRSVKWEDYEGMKTQMEQD